MKNLFLLARLLVIMAVSLRADPVDLTLVDIGSADLYLTASKYEVAFKMPGNAPDLHNALQAAGPFVSAYAALIQLSGPYFAIKMRSDSGFGYTEDEYWNGETHYVYNQESRRLSVSYGPTDISPFAKYISTTCQAGITTFTSLKNSYKTSARSEVLRETSVKGKWIYEIERDDGYALRANLLKLTDGGFMIENYALSMPGGTIYSAFTNEFAGQPATAEEVFKKIKTIYRLDLSPGKKYECMRYEVQLIRQGLPFSNKRFRPDMLGEISVWDRRIIPSVSYTAIDHELPVEKLDALAKSRPAEKKWKPVNEEENP